MRQNRHMRRLFCGILALMSGFALPGAVQADSGLSDTPQAIGRENYYVGANGASNNAVNVDKNMESAGVISGYAGFGPGSSEANENHLTVTAGGDVNGHIYGGYARSDSTSAVAGSNSVTVSDGKISYDACGGNAWSISGEAVADGNSVAVSGDTVSGNIFGGHGYSGAGRAEADHNSVAVSGGTVKGMICGGWIESEGDNAAADYNTVTMSGGAVQGSIYGGYVMNLDGSAETNSNRVTVSGGAVSVSKMGSVYGGWAYSGNQKAAANQNNVLISGGTVTAAEVFGGMAMSRTADAEANSNGVMVSGNLEVTGEIAGGYAKFGNAAASYNSLIVSGGTFQSGMYGGYAYSDSGDVMADNNSLLVHGNAEVTGTVAGGYAVSESGDASAKGNSVAISGGIFQDFVYGGYAEAEAGSAESGGNSLLVNGNAEFHGDIVGGFAKGDSSKVSNNGVTVSGGTFTDIYGGMASGKNGVEANGNLVTLNGGSAKIVLGGLAYSESGDASAKGNSVTISGGTVTGAIYGGYAGSNSGSAETTNNKVILSGIADVSGADLYGRNSEASGGNNSLVINGWSGTVKSLNNFDQLDVRAVAGGQNLTGGSKLQLITANSMTDCEFDGQSVKDIQAGVALTVDGTIRQDGNALLIDTSSVRASDQTAIATESRAASVAVVGRGAEAVTDSLNALRGSGEGLDTFAAVIGSRSRYDTGSHVDVNGWNGIAGTAWTRELSSGTLHYGAFYENGGGSYDTFNTINGSSYRGSGDTVYNGGGLLLRWEARGGTYTEASLRAGMVKNEVGPALEFAGNRYGFKTENNYYGGHVGIGRIMERDDGDAWDIYGKYFHMHHEGDTVTIAGDEFAFDAVDSDRLRVGARYLDRKNDRFTGYYGVAWDYEFSGDTGGTANHHAMYTPSLKGSTLIAEIGFRGTPGGDSPWSFGVDLRGYAGEQEGLSGTVTAAYSF